MRKRYIMNRGFNNVVRVWTCLTYVILFAPIVFVTLLSFNNSSYGLMPFHFTTKWYLALFTESELLDSTKNSFIFAAQVSACATVVGTMASLGLRTLSKRVNGILTGAVKIPMTIPWLVQAIAMLLLFNFLGIGKSYVGMFFGNLLVVVPYVFILTYNQLHDMDRSAEDAGRTLGATPGRVFFTITVPMIFPSILAGWLMSFMTCFNSFTIQQYLAPFGFRTLPMEVYNVIKSGLKPDLNALCAIMCVFSVLIVMILNKLGYSAKKLF